MKNAFKSCIQKKIVYFLNTNKLDSNATKAQYEFAAPLYSFPVKVHEKSGKDRRELSHQDR